MWGKVIALFAQIVLVQFKIAFLQTPHPLEDHAEKAVHTVCCRPGHVSCSITLPKRAYVSGENLRTEVVVHNMSIRKSGAVSLQLKQVIIKSMFRNKVKCIMHNNVLYLVLLCCLYRFSIKMNIKKARYCVKPNNDGHSNQL